MTHPMIRAGALTLIGAAMVTLTLGCGADGNEDQSGTARQEIVGVDSYLYLRCNATGWNVDAATRLQPTADPYVFTLEYEVTQPWMLQGGDQCVFTETPALDAWGNWQRYFGTRFGASLDVPGAAPLQDGQRYFTVRYPALGRYRATVNWRDGGLSIAAVEAEPTWPTYSVLPVLFVPTNWDVNSAEVQAEAAALEVAMEEIQDYYGTALASRLGGKSFRLNALEVVQGEGPIGDYGIVHNGGSIYTDGVEFVDNMEAAVVAELYARGFPTPPAQNEEGYVTLMFVKGAGGYAGGRELYAADGGWAILGDWCIDSIDGTIPEGDYWWSGRRMQVGAAAHELGHTFGLPHPDAYAGDFEGTVMGAWWNYPTVGFDDWGKNELATSKSHWFE